MPPNEKKDTSYVSPASTTTASASVSSGKEKETVIIFDWDDTLLASSFLASKGYKLDSTMERTPEIDNQLKHLESSVIALLTMALNFGRVHIITNAENGWVQLSAQKFIPGVLPLLGSKVKVVSARSSYESMFPVSPQAPQKWKFCAFQEKIMSSNCKCERNIISFGDSQVEREAVRLVTRGLQNTRTKSVKFAEKPSMEQLRRQIELVTNCFAYIFKYDGDLDLELTVSVNSPPSPPASPTSSNTTAPSCSTSSATTCTASSTTSTPNNTQTTADVEMSDSPAPMQTCAQAARATSSFNAPTQRHEVEVRS